MNNKLSFRSLKANEIDARIGSIKATGLSLLLYKDARVDMNLLDEVVGPLNWKREHTRDNANCIVSIYDESKKEWVSKEDTGTESFTEKEKGKASDSFKRTCVNWGIGRELYTAPFIWINAKDVTIKEKKCYDKFEVKEIAYTDGIISKLIILNKKSGKTIYTYIQNAPKAPTKTPIKPKSTPGSAPVKPKASANFNKEIKELLDLVKLKGRTNDDLLTMMKAKFKKEHTRELTGLEIEKLTKGYAEL